MFLREIPRTERQCSTVHGWQGGSKNRSYDLKSHPAGRAGCLTLKGVSLTGTSRKIREETGSVEAHGHAKLESATYRKEFGVSADGALRLTDRLLPRVPYNWRKDRYVPYRSVSKERQFKREVWGPP